MKPVHRGIAVAVLQCLIVLSLAGKYAIDRQSLPRVWVKTAPVDPNLPIRGRYVSLRLPVDGPSSLPDSSSQARLSVQNGHLTATPATSGVSIFGWRGQWILTEPVAFFISEGIPDPSRRALGEELWVEVSVPPQGIPRPLRLGVKRDGVLTPLDLH
ncbi:MAG TPA: hypothetical protein VG096_20300 [Bryobacteraceae bacterium]|jgi:hypothetical protein|nr:hypothetical protein [Bryobacteraceae bacterium]